MADSNGHFAVAHAFTAAHEGGLSEHPADPGGITNYGVSLRWIQEQGIDINGDGSINAADIRSCTPARAAELMRLRFWDAMRCGSLPLPLAVVVYDTGVNCGPGRAVRLLQSSCNIVGEANLDAYSPLCEDGVCGPRTIAMTKALAEAGLSYYTARHCLRARQALYKNIVRNKPALHVFLRGWNNRCTDLFEYLAQLERED